MTQSRKTVVIPDPWQSLQAFTEARIALGRAGSSLPLAESLKFKLAHARARDAVRLPADLAGLAGQLEAAGHQVLLLESSAGERAEYLTRPDKGRQPSAESLSLLEQQPKGFDICLIVCDGLSAPAIAENALAVVTGFLELLRRTPLSAAPVCLVKNGRVAIGDRIAHLLGCRLAVVLVGERPGLSSPNSLGAYITLHPAPGTTDESRNCVSNIRKGGMSGNDAVRKIAYLVESAMRLGRTGVALKDRMGSDYLPFVDPDSLAPQKRQD